MSVVNRVVLAGLICAAMGAQAVAAPVADDPGSTKGRALHASKCVVTLGFGGGCDKDQADSKRAAEKAVAAEKAAAERPAGEVPAVETKVADDHSTRHQFFNASECVVTFGFAGQCDKNAPAGVQKVSHRAEGPPAAPDTTRGRFFQAGTCVISLGFLGNCDKR